MADITNDNVLSAWIREFCKIYDANPDESFRGKQQGEFTLDDYYALPQERRVELINGVIFEMEAPSFAHQRVLSKLDYFFEDFIEKNGGLCQVLPAPTDVWLDQDEKTMVQPDLSIMCDPTQEDGRRIVGCPDFIAEILSPSTRAKDMHLKLVKYFAAGVREYWIIDLRHTRVLVYLADGSKDFSNANVTIYGFQDTIPVGIYDGKMKVDFSRIYAVIKDMAGVGDN